MPNMLAQIVLLSWPLVTWMLFRKLKPAQAVFATILLGYLFIPERVSFSVPVLPPISKGFFPSLCAAIGLWIVHRQAAQKALRAARRNPPPAAVAEPDARAAGRDAGRRKGRMSGAGISRISWLIPATVAVLLAGIVLTWATNQEALVYGGRVLAGLVPYDIGSMMKTLIIMLLPFWLGRRYLNDRETLLGMIKIIVWCGLAYSFMVLWESRMSPRLNVILYGFFAHDWLQHIRGGAFRPIVFLSHGLRVGIFMAMAVLAAGVLARINADGRRGRWLMITAWLLACLVLSRNLGATMIAVPLLVVILFFPLRLQFLVGALLGVLVLFYPLARGGGLIPADRVVNAVYSFNPERAGSLSFRLDNEDMLMQKANQKPLAGWGGWGRSRVYNEQSGVDESVTDGGWIILIGTSGWIGYLGQFGLLCLPAIFAALRYRRYRFDLLDAGGILILSANLVDLLPNSSMTPVLWAWGGMLWGRLIVASSAMPEEDPAPKRSVQERGNAAPPVAGPGRRRRNNPVYSRNVTPSKT